MQELEVGLGDRSYPIIIDNGCLQRVGDDLFTKNIAKRYGVVADDMVDGLYGDMEMAKFKAAGINGELLTSTADKATQNLQNNGHLA